MLECGEEMPGQQNTLGQKHAWDSPVEYSKGRKAGVDQSPLHDESAPEHRGGDNRRQAS